MKLNRSARIALLLMSLFTQMFWAQTTQRISYVTGNTGRGLNMVGDRMRDPYIKAFTEDKQLLWEMLGTAGDGYAQFTKLINKRGKLHTTGFFKGAITMGGKTFGNTAMKYQSGVYLTANKNQEIESVYQLTSENGVCSIEDIKKERDTLYMCGKVSENAFLNDLPIKNTNLGNQQYGYVASFLPNQKLAWQYTKPNAGIVKVMPTHMGNFILGYQENVETKKVSVFVDRIGKYGQVLWTKVLTEDAVIADAAGVVDKYGALMDAVVTTKLMMYVSFTQKNGTNRELKTVKMFLPTAGYKTIWEKTIITKADTDNLVFRSLTVSRGKIYHGLSFGGLISLADKGELKSKATRDGLIVALDGNANVVTAKQLGGTGTVPNNFVFVNSLTKKRNGQIGFVGCHRGDIAIDNTIVLPMAKDALGKPAVSTTDYWFDVNKANEDEGLNYVSQSISVVVSQKQFSIYPNPVTTESITVKTDMEIKPYQVLTFTLFDYFGQKKWQQTIKGADFVTQQQTLTIGAQLAGKYVLQLGTAGALYHTEIIVK